VARTDTPKPPEQLNILIRRAKIEDEPHVRAFTQNTFEWGDYVADSFSEWLEGGHDVYVAEIGGLPVGVTCVAYPAEGEAWFQGIRVKAELRRMGIASMLTKASTRGAKERGARVCRAHIDSDNFRSQGLAKTMGFRLATRIAEFTVPVAGYSLASADNRMPGDDARNGFGSADASVREAIEVTRATPEEAGLLFESASKEIHYLGCDYTWLSLTRQNLIRAATEEWLLVARDASGRTLAGGLMSNPYVEDHIHTEVDDHIHTESEDEHAGEYAHSASEEAYLCAALGSLFGTTEGAVAIIRHALELLRAEVAKKNITPGELFVAVETEIPLAEEILSYSRQAHLDMQVHGETDLWELRLTS
jgi:ribosomal protein S18 acetylase RimI-like enzyme